MSQLDQPYLRVANVSKAFHGHVAVDAVSLDIAEGEFICILGPSGCGKTTLLRIIAGLERQDSGRLYQAGADISDLPPRQRDFGIVFQSYALFPNLTAAQNIAYGLENRKLPRQKIDARVAELLQLMGLPSVGHRYPSQLSGGQQQRVALARALATSPGLLLLDEPFSALDAQVRASLREEMKQVQKRLGVTTILVTHDQEEALVLADRVVVMKDGRIEQVGAPKEIYHTPTTAFVANFIGIMNFLPAHTTAVAHEVRVGDFTVRAGSEPTLSPDTPILVAIRPEDIELQATQAATNAVEGRVQSIAFLGAQFRLTVQIDGLETPVVVDVPKHLMNGQRIEVSQPIRLDLPEDRMCVYLDNVSSIEPQRH